MTEVRQADASAPRAGTQTRRRQLVTESFLFPLAALYGAVAVPLSVWEMLGGQPAIPGLSTPIGHAHELLFGYALAVVAGFLVQRTTPLELGLLVGLWLAARVAFLALPGSPLALAADVGFAVVMARTVAPRWMKAARRWRNRVTGPLVLALCLALVAFQLGAVADAAAVVRLARDEAVLSLALLMLFFGGRLITAAGVGREVGVQPRLEGAILLAMIGAVISAALPLASPATGMLLIGAGSLALVRLLRWRPWHRSVDVLCLGVGYAWVGVGLVLLGSSRGLGWGPPAAVATHAITVGALGTLTTNVMARTRLFRLRVPLAERTSWLLAMTVLMSLAALLRMLGASRPAWLLGAAVCWALAQITLLALLARDR